MSKKENFTQCPTQNPSEPKQKDINREMKEKRDKQSEESQNNQEDKSKKKE